jgi:Family of unknown function (DUF6491)
MRYWIVGLAGLACASAALAKPAPVWPELGVETSIQFPERNIDNFEADQDRGIWIEDRKHRWYYAKFIGHCPGLQFVQGIGFDTRGSSRFDRTSKILVEDDRCQIESLVTAAKPLPRKEREKARKSGANEALKP